MLWPLIVAAMLGLPVVPTQDVPTITESHGGFGFPNLSGTEIIVLHEMPRASELRTAICTGRQLSIGFVRRQAGTAGAIRESPRFFDALEGTVFQVLGQTLGPDDTCLVAPDSLIERAQVLQPRPLLEPAECTDAERRRLAAVRARPMRAYWKIAALRPEGFVGLVEYVRAGRDALASLIIVTKDRAIPFDFPATYRGAHEELWRAGDGGDFFPFGFRVPFIVERADTYLVAVDWSGEEGNLLTLYTWKAGSLARPVIQDYWYRAGR